MAQTHQGDQSAHNVLSTAGIAWSWESAALGAAYALPAAVVTASDPQHGIAFAVGVLPPAIVGLPPRRRGRLLLVLIGLLTGLPMLVGGLLASVPVLAVLAIAGLGVGAAALAARSPAGQIAIVLSLPMVGVGLSYSDVGKAAGLAALMVAGSAYACLVSMLWPERSGPRERRPLAAPSTLSYGVRLGAAGASAAAIGFLFDFEHVGWACAAALLVMRPQAEMQRLRSVGRICAVAAGALIAVALIRLEPGSGWYAIAVLTAIAGAAATRESRWYVTAAFTTFLVFLLLLYSNPEQAGWRLGERLGETVLGVALAYFFGLALPALARRRAQPSPA
jgi:fusaric acid resistance family protein